MKIIWAQTFSNRAYPAACASSQLLGAGSMKVDSGHIAPQRRILRSNQEKAVVGRTYGAGRGETGGTIKRK